METDTARHSPLSEQWRLQVLRAADVEFAL